MTATGDIDGFVRETTTTDQITIWWNESDDDFHAQFMESDTMGEGDTVYEAVSNAVAARIGVLTD